MDQNKNLDKESTVGRLQSLKLPRDLSLGIPRQKKQYAPNLNVVRNKFKTKEIIKKTEIKKKEKPNIKHREDNKARFIQSTGIFSQGSAESKKLQSEKYTLIRDGTSLSTSSSSSSSNVIEKPKIKKELIEINKIDEDNIIKDLLNYGCDSDDDIDVNSIKPLSLVSYKNPINSVKKENRDNNNYNYKIPQPFNNEGTYSDESPSISLVKLPDSFAGKGLSDDPNCKKLFDYPLNGMLDGQIGKLIIRKSGKIEVEIGRVKYELESEDYADCKQDLVTIVESAETKSSIAILGSVLNNFLMYPNYDNLLNGKNT